MNDKITGYIILTIISIVLIAPMVYVLWRFFTPLEIRTVDFGTISSMEFFSNQDPVRIKGVQVGVIRDISMLENHAIVQIESKKPLEIHEGYSIFVFQKGILSDKYVLINPGDPSAPIIDKRKILTGTFVNGPSDIIAYSDKLRTSIRKLTDLTTLLKDGTTEKESFIVQFSKMSSKIDSISGSIIMSENALNTFFETKKDSINFIFDKIGSLTDTLQSSLPLILTDLNKQIISIEKLMKDIDLLISKSEPIIDTLSNSKNTIWQNDLKILQKDLGDLRTLLKDIRYDGLKLPVRAW
jgi:ABC-type transporter Mla subunit MlaD